MWAVLGVWAGLLPFVMAYVVLLEERLWGASSVRTQRGLLRMTLLWLALGLLISAVLLPRAS